jgi:hypothetical protein
MKVENVKRDSEALLAQEEGSVVCGRWGLCVVVAVVVAVAGMLIVGFGPRIHLREGSPKL